MNLTLKTPRLLELNLKNMLIQQKKFEAENLKLFPSQLYLGISFFLN